MSSKFKILITDDDGDLRELLTEALKNWGYAVSVAVDGNDALNQLKKEKHDIVITDLMMPGMDGLALLQSIKDFDKDILVIMITGYATIETAVKAIEVGAYDYIAKPFRLDELMIVIKNARERLRLISRNNELLDELRRTHDELEALKKTVSDMPYSPSYTAGAEASARIEGPRTAKQHEYVKEADRFVRNKPVTKS